jgi:nicotinate-nucleotide pyrophosphorylase (carboxylating)
MSLLDTLLGHRIDRVMLDNFTPAEIAIAVKRIDEFYSNRSSEADRSSERIEVEVSGGITLQTVRAHSISGVDFISVGALTHSAPATSLSLKFQPSQ